MPTLAFDNSEDARSIRQAVAAGRRLVPHLAHDYAERAITERRPVREVKAALFRIIVANIDALAP